MQEFLELNRHAVIHIGGKVVMSTTLPGPFAPPGSNLPRRNITALSYSCTICWKAQSAIFPSCHKKVFFFILLRAKTIQHSHFINANPLFFSRKACHYHDRILHKLVHVGGTLQAEIYQQLYQNFNSSSPLVEVLLRIRILHLLRRELVAPIFMTAIQTGCVFFVLLGGGEIAPIVFQLPIL